MQALFRAWASPLKFLNQVYSPIKRGKRGYPQTQSEVFSIQHQAEFTLDKCYFFTSSVPQQPTDSSGLTTVARQALLFTMQPLGFPGGASESTCQCRRHKRHRFNSWIGKIPWRRKWQPTPVFLSTESHGQRSLLDYSPWDCKESDMTEVTQQTCWKRIHLQCRRRGFDPQARKILWIRKWQPTPVFLPGRSYGLMSYRPWGHKRVGHDLVTEEQQSSQKPRPSFPQMRGASCEVTI